MSAEREIYGKALRAAYAVTKKKYKAVRGQKSDHKAKDDEANAVASVIAYAISEGENPLEAFKRPRRSDADVLAALEAVGRLNIKNDETPDRQFTQAQMDALKGMKTYFPAGGGGPRLRVPR